MTKRLTDPAVAMPFVMHGHHEGRSPIEVLMTTIAERRAEIRERKPKSEQPTRLRLLKLVRGKLPAALVKARDKAHAARDKAYAAWEKAHAALMLAIDKHRPTLLALHAEECKNCPWDGSTIFPAKG